MDDARIWELETSLWTGGPERYRELVDEACLMVLPAPPYVLSGEQAIEAVASTPQWSEAELSEQQVSRPAEGLVVVAYHIRVSREHETYAARCTSTYRRLGDEAWTVVQHQQTPPLAAAGAGE